MRSDMCSPRIIAAENDDLFKMAGARRATGGGPTAHTRYCGLMRCGDENTVKVSGRVCGTAAAKALPSADSAVLLSASAVMTLFCWHSTAAIKRHRCFTAAGFVEVAGNTEEAVAREVMEESWIEIQNIRYVSSQPWPPRTR